MTYIDAEKAKRDKERSKFGALVNDKPRKIQIGARGQKNGPDWIALDKFDHGPLIDEHHDLHDLPYEDCSVDCYVCNAVLEHVFEPQLAIFEMYRTLKVGGHIWIEIPFNQFYHAHPHDFRRWTVQGLAQELYRFKEGGKGVSNYAIPEVRKIAKAMMAESSVKNIPEASLVAIEEAIHEYSQSTKLLRLYSACYFWGEKTEHNVDAVDIEFMSRIKKRVLAATQQ